VYEGHKLQKKTALGITST